MTGGTRRWFWGLLAAALVGRVAFGFATFGVAYDMHSYTFVDHQLRGAPLDLYALLKPAAFNWPYPPGYFPWVLAAGGLSRATGLAFHGLVGLPAIAADGAIAWFVQDYLGRRGASQRTRLLAAGLVLLGPVLAVNSGYVNQLDSVAILPAVIALWLWERGDERRALHAGLLIGAGCALKTVPIFMLLALLPSVRSRREGMALVGFAVAVPLVLLAPWLLHSPHATVKALNYAGVPGAGGLSLVLQPNLAADWLTGIVAHNRFTDMLIANRALVNIGALLAVGMFAFRNRTSPVRAAILVWLALYVFGTGFFFQYLVWGLPFMLMAGYLRSVMAIQVLAAGPMLLFYLGPWKTHFVVPLYAGLMAALWLLFLVGLALLSRRELSEAIAESRRRPAFVDAVVGKLSGRPHPLQATRAWIRFANPAIFVLFALFSLGPLVLLLADGGTFTGADGPYAGDQLQYMAWIRDAGEHLLVSNSFDLAPSGHVFLHPMYALSGIGWKITGSLQAWLLVWKPVAVAILFLGFAAYARRMVEGAAACAAALCLAIFFVSPVGPLADWLGISGNGGAELISASAGSIVTGVLSWGYLPAVLAVGLMPVFLLSVERLLRQPQGGGRRSIAAHTASASAVGLLASWLHPWQGETLVVIIAGLAVWGGVPRARLIVPTLAALAPLAYYAELTRADSAWALARVANQRPAFHLAVVLVVGAPLLIPALFALKSPGQDSQERMLLLWPVAALAVHYGLPTFPEHSLQGVTLPLAVLAVRGWQRLSWSPAVAAVAIVLVTVPGGAWEASRFHDNVELHAQPYHLTPGEADALSFLASSSVAGGVLSTSYLGPAIPAFTGRSVWSGHPSWTPTWADRNRAADALFEGRLRPSRARRLVRAAGATFLVSDCRRDANLRAVLHDDLIAARRFDCAAVYELRNRH